MKRYKIYAGMGGGFGGATYECTIEAASERDAEQYAYDLAVEQYQSHEGYHGILSWEEYLEDLEMSGFVGDDMSDGEIEDIVNEHYLNEIDSWIDYYAIETTDEDEEEEE
jgi:hypothetical protein